MKNEKNITTLPTNYSSNDQARKAAERQAKILTARGYPTKAIEPTEVKYNTQEGRHSVFTFGTVVNHTGWKARVQDA